METQTQKGFKEIYLRLANEIYNASETEDWNDSYYQTMLTLAEIKDLDVQTLLAGALHNFKYRLVKKCFNEYVKDCRKQVRQFHEIGKKLPREYLTPSTIEGFNDIHKTLNERRERVLADEDWTLNMDEGCPTIEGEDYEEYTEDLLFYMFQEIVSIWTREVPSWY